MKILAAVFAVIFISILVGCASQKDRMIANGFPPAYAAGYQDGCDTANNMVNWGGGVHKNVNAYQSNAKYKTGYDDGYEQCKTRAQSINRAMGL